MLQGAPTLLIKEIGSLLVLVKSNETQLSYKILQILHLRGYLILLSIIISM